MHLPNTPHFGLSQNSLTIEHVGYGLVHAYHFETCTIKVFIPLWYKHATMPLTRIADCFNGRITTHNYIFTKPLRAPSPSPACPILHLLYSYFMPFMPFLLLLSCFLFWAPFILPCIHFLPAHVGSFRLLAYGSQPQLHTFPNTPFLPTTPILEYIKNAEWSVQDVINSSLSAILD